FYHSSPQSIQLRHLPSPVPTHTFSFNDTAATEIYTLSLHDALPIYPKGNVLNFSGDNRVCDASNKISDTEEVASSMGVHFGLFGDRKSTRLNSSHQIISYAVFCLKKKNSRADTRTRRRS